MNETTLAFVDLKNIRVGGLYNVFSWCNFQVITYLIFARTGCGSYFQLVAVKVGTQIKEKHYNWYMF